MSQLRLFKNGLPEGRKPEMLANLKRNWYFPISALAVFCLNARFNIGYFLGIPIAFLAAALIASQVPSLKNWEKANPKALRIFSFLTAIGICWDHKVAFCSGWAISPKALALTERFPMLPQAISIVSIAGAVAGFCFAYLWVLTFWKKLLQIISNLKLFHGISPAEWVVYSLLAAVTIGWMAYAFCQSEAFYKSTLPESVITGAIYTSDSSMLLDVDNAFLSLSNAENDIRQPLFAVFAAPVLGLPYLLGRLTGAQSTLEAVLMNGVQICILFIAHLILAKLMKLDSRKRLCFMLLLSCTYVHMLFTLMIEQYIFAYFWLVLCMYLISEKQSSRGFALCGAGGTIMTSMVLLPFCSRESPLRSPKEWFLDTVRYGLGFLAMLLLFCRFEIIYSPFSKLSLYSNFFGRELTFADKLYQYTAFLRSCLLRPDAGIKVQSPVHISWQLHEAVGIDLIGVVILALVIVSAVLNRSKISSRFAIGWVGFSVVILLLLGWGTSENGLILYGLYFGWALFVLLFQLAEKLETYTKTKFLLPVFTALSAVFLLLCNIPSILEMVEFLIQYYPV